MTDLRVTMIQTMLHWHDAEANRKMFCDQIKNMDHETDLIILPEMFTTGFSMDSSVLAEEMDGPTMSWMARLSDERRFVITGSLIIRDKSDYFNRLIWMYPDGSYDYYDKRHLFGMAQEHLHYVAGKKRLITSHLGWNICPMICYDLRFPVWSRSRNDYDLLIYVANWPDKRISAWSNLLRARAIENQSYCVGVNRVGEDSNGYLYTGQSAIIDPSGAVLCDVKSDEEGIFTTTLSADHLQNIRQKFPFLQDADDFEIIN